MLESRTIIGFNRPRNALVTRLKNSLLVFSKNSIIFALQLNLNTAEFMKRQEVIRYGTGNRQRKRKLGKRS